MKKTGFVIALFIVAITLNCNTKETSDLAGGCYDLIKFSEHQSTFDAGGGSRIITYDKNKKWAASLIFWVDTIVYQLWTKYNDTDSTSYPYYVYESENADGIMQIEAPWADILWSAPGQLTYVVAPNVTGKERKISWSAGAGNCFRYLSITQSAE